MRALLGWLAAAAIGAASSVPKPDPNVFQPGAELNPEALEAFVLARTAAGAAQLVVRPGTYTVPGPEQPGGYVRNGGCGAHVCLGHGSVGFSSVALDMSGVTLVLGQRNRTAVFVQNSESFQLTGLTTRFAELPTNQARLSIDESGAFLATIPAGYPLSDWEAFAAGGTKKGKATISCNVFDPRTRNWKKGTADLSITVNATSEPRIFRIDTGAFHQPRFAGANIADGDLLGCRPLAGAFTFHVQNCSNSTFRGITLAGGTSFGYFMGGANRLQNTFDNVRIIRPPQPAGATEEPLLAMGADGFHNAGNKIGPKIVNSYFERMTDDGIAIHGGYALVVTKLNASSAVLQTQGSYLPDVGDTFRLYDRSFVPTKSDHIVASMARMASEWRPVYNESHSLPRDGFNYDGPYWAIQFEQPLESLPPGKQAFDFVMNNADRNGNGFILRNNTIRDHRARGMLIKASDGLIEDCTINGSTLGGIVITPELSWGEADFVRGLVVRNNRIMNVGYGKQSYGAIALGATAFINKQRRFDAGRGHKNVSLINNTISDLETWALWVSSASGVVLKDNRFERIWELPTWADCCPPYPVPDNNVIFMTEADGVEATGNCIVSHGTYATTLVNVTATVSVAQGSQSAASWSQCSPQ